MTTPQSKIINDDKYIPCLDHGFVGLVDHMGSDHSIVQAARVSYGAGTKSVRKDRGLIRYLLRRHHWTPFEMAEVKFHVKLPIFVARQLIRHRTSNVNEYSARYSEMSNEFYVPEHDVIQAQSSTNNQGRGNDIDDVSKEGVRWLIKQNSIHAYNTYLTLMGKDEGFIDNDDPIYDAYDSDDPLLTQEFKDNDGVAREIARTTLPVGNYTELYWKQDLRNLMHLVHLRADSHAQYEIRVYADAIYQFIKKLYPVAMEAWEDYVRDAVVFSRMEKQLLLELLGDMDVEETVSKMAEQDEFMERSGLTQREIYEFIEKLRNR